VVDNAKCSGCGRAIAELPDDPALRQPCPRCGSTNVTISLSATTSIRMTSTASPTIIPYAETLLAKAKELISSGDHSIATVVAHMACEISAERALSSAYAAKDIGYLEESVRAFMNGYNLATERNRDLYVALSGKRVQDQPFWQAFKDSAVRRNRAVHGSVLVSKDEAEASYRAASDLVAYLR
jgi:phage FluMu protein Com